MQAAKESAVPGVLTALQTRYAALATVVCQKWVDEVCRPAEKAFHELLNSAGIAVTVPLLITADLVDAARVNHEAHAAAEAIATLQQATAAATNRARIEQLNTKASASFQAMRGKPFKVNVEELFDNHGQKRVRGEIVIAGTDVDLFTVENYVSSLSGYKLLAVAA